MIVSDALVQKKPASAEAAAAEAEEPEAEPDTGGEKTHFHGKSLVDYAGNSWLEPPKDKKKQGDECFLPKRWVHTWCADALRLAVVSAEHHSQERALKGRCRNSLLPGFWPPLALRGHGQQG